MSGLALFIALALGAAACSGGDADASSASSPSPDPSAAESPESLPTPTVEPSTNLDAITVTGAFGTAPTVTFTAPWAIDQTRTKVLSEGTGPTISATSTVRIQYHGVDGRSGSVFDESFTTGGEGVAFPLSNVIAGFQKGLTDQKVGSRVLIGIPGSDGYDSQGGASSAGIEVGDTLIFVVDILDASRTEPSGTAVTPADGLPTVSDDIAKPVVTIPAGLAKPDKLVVQPLIKSDGRAVTASDTIMVNYTEVAWSTGQVVKQTFGYQPLEGALSSTIAGWQQGLVGQTIGSRVLLVVPGDLAYPSGNSKLGVKAGETMVYVIDILFAYSN